MHAVCGDPWYQGLLYLGSFGQSPQGSWKHLCRRSEREVFFFLVCSCIENIIVYSISALFVSLQHLTTLLVGQTGQTVEPA